MISAVVCLVDIALILVMNYVKDGTDMEMLLVTLAAACAVGIVMMAVMIPLQLKFGSEKRQMAMIAGFVIFFFLLYVGKKLVDRFGVPSFINKIGSLSMGYVAGMIAILVIVMTLISYWISVRIMEKKEL